MEVLIRKNDGLVVVAKPDGWNWSPIERGLVKHIRDDQTEIEFFVVTVPDATYNTLKDKVVNWELKMDNVATKDYRNIRIISDQNELKTMRER